MSTELNQTTDGPARTRDATESSAGSEVSESGYQDQPGPDQKATDQQGERFLHRITGLAAGIRLPRTRYATIVAAVLVVLLGCATGGFFWLRANELPDQLAFRVGDRDVSIDELDRESDTLRALYGVQPPQDPAKLNTYRRDLAKSYAVGLVLDKAAADQNIVIPDKTARDVLSRYITQMFGGGPDAHDKFVQALGNVGASESTVLDEIKRQLRVSDLFDRVTRGVTVSDQDVRDAFAKRKDSLGTPERRDIHNIVVGTPDEANQVMDQLRSGASFESVAQQRSLDGSTRDNGGDLGQVSLSQLEGDYGKQAFATPPNGTFGPVQNKYGWNVGKVEQILPPSPAVFDQVKDTLKQQLQLERSMNVWRNWLGNQIEAAHVQYADQYRPGSPDAPPDLQPSQATGPNGSAGQPGPQSGPVHP